MFGLVTVLKKAQEFGVVLYNNMRCRDKLIFEGSGKSDVFQVFGEDKDKLSGID